MQLSPFQKNSMFQSSVVPSNFFMTGINFRNSNEKIRGSFHVSSESYASLINQANNEGIKELFVVSTCNRTEIYGFSSSANHLARLLCDHVKGDFSTFKSHAYTYKNEQAVKHFFHMVSGLDSQILGDYEIVGQVKTAVDIARENNALNAYTERLINMALAASKEVKNRTSLSSGTVSVSFANVQYINNHIHPEDQRNMHAVVIGAGSMGRNTCKNLKNHCKFQSTTLLNRTLEKARDLAEQLEINYGSFDALPALAKEASVIIVATGADEFVITPEMLSDQSFQLVIDLSLPANVDPSINQLGSKTLISLDELSKVKDETLEQRKTQIPKAEKILRKYLHEFASWRKKRKYAPFLKNVKNTLVKINEHQDSQFFDTTISSTTMVNSVVRHTAKRVQSNNNYGCQFLMAINDYISVEN